jgi:hypothetical protein
LILMGGWCATDATPSNETRRMRSAGRSLFNDARNAHRRDALVLFDNGWLMGGTVVAAVRISDA